MTYHQGGIFITNNSSQLYQKVENIFNGWYITFPQKKTQELFKVRQIDIAQERSSQCSDHFQNLRHSTHPPQQTDTFRNQRN